MWIDMRVNKLFFSSLFWLLASLSFANTVTYTVISKDELRVTGDEPIGSMAEYSQSANSGRIGQMTDGNHTLLTLYGYQGLKIRSVTLKMRSNKSSGAGLLEMMVNDEMVWTIEPAYFSEDAWHGSYSDSFVPIQHYFENPIKVAQSGVISIIIESLENSLYIQSYTFDYYIPATQPCTVSFYTGTETVLEPITEEYLESGILLPELTSAIDDWFFRGWSMTPVIDIDIAVPYLMNPHERFMPSENCTLYAVYSNYATERIGLVQDTMYVSGDYILSSAFDKCMAYGGLNRDKRITTVPLDLEDTDEDGLYLYPLDRIYSATVYHLDFSAEDSTVIIRNNITGEYIGFNPDKSQETLTNTKSRWHYKILQDRSIAFYHQYETQRRELSSGYGNTMETIDSLWYYNTLFVHTKEANILFCTDDYADRDDELFTSFYVDSRLNLIGQDAPPAMVYSIDGKPLCRKSDWHLLPAGYYILWSNDKFKVVKK